MARGGVTTGCDPAMLVEAICTAMIEQQRDLSARVVRCSGRTLQRRQQTMLHLLRVRHLIESSGDERPDLVRLARSANYSPWHLIRVHRDVFGETPSEYAARLRLQHAWSPVRDTKTSICEISAALGFESQSAFCRSFKQTFGCTPTQARSAQDESGALAASVGDPMAGSALCIRAARLPLRSRHATASGPAFTGKTGRPAFT